MSFSAQCPSTQRFAIDTGLTPPRRGCSLTITAESPAFLVTKIQHRIPHTWYIELTRLGVEELLSGREGTLHLNELLIRHQAIDPSHPLPPSFPSPSLDCPALALYKLPLMVILATRLG